MNPAMLNVFLTVDTEFWPHRPDSLASGCQQDIARDIDGVTPEGEFGLGFQIDMLNAHRLKAVFFVEALSADVVGAGPLRRITRQILEAGHEVQLHLHSEWLARLSEPILSGKTGNNLKDFSEDDQALLLARGLQNLRDAGAPDVCAFRAGNYGANFDTLRALKRNGIRYDSSYNAMYLDSDCGMRTSELLIQPVEIEGVCEVPITFFKDWRGRPRHVQLVACSSPEIETALQSAWKGGWSSFVIVSHSFELLRNRKSPGRAIAADRFVIRRFEQLCRFLSDNRDRFHVAGFAAASVKPAGSSGVRSLSMPIYPTGRRIIEQAIRRLS